MHNFHRFAVHVIFARLSLIVIRQHLRRGVKRNLRFFLFMLVFDVRKHGFFCQYVPIRVNFLFFEQVRVAVKFRIGKMLGGGTGIIQNREIEFVILFPDPASAPDDLFELGHRTDDAGNHDIFAGGNIDTGSQQLRGSQDHGRFLLRILKAAQVSAPNRALFRCHPADIMEYCRFMSGFKADNAWRISSA